MKTTMSTMCMMAMALFASVSMSTAAEVSSSVRMEKVAESASYNVGVSGIT